ncbi:MAG: helix-turn-helix domain-containing protein [Anaerovoracaceae bacterium]
MDLGTLIYSKRKEKNMTQEQLAETLNVARQTVSKWETNESAPDLNSLKKLATVLNFSIDKAFKQEDGAKTTISWNGSS